MSSTDSLPTSRLRFLSGCDLAVIPGPVEWTPATVEILESPECLPELQLLLNGIDLPVYRRFVGGQERLLADWDRRGPGRYRLEVRLRGQTEATAIEVAPRKISQAAFSRMLEDLERDLPCSIAIGLANAGGLTGIESQSLQPITAEEDLQRLRLALYGAKRPGLIEILTRIAKDPHHVFIDEERWELAERARRPRADRLVLGLRKANNLSKEGHLRSVADSRVQPSVDVYENRLVRAFVDAVDVRLRALARYQSSSVIQESARQMLRDLTIARAKAAFLKDVGLPRGVPTRVTMVLLYRPEYRAALECYREFCRSLRVELHEDRIESPLENLPYLYELWCTLRVIAALLTAAGKNGYCVVQQRLVTRDAGGLWIQPLEPGRVAVELVNPVTGIRVTLTPQRVYALTGKPFRTVSFQQIPDITIAVETPGYETAIYLLDPKYKLDGEALAEADPTVVRGSPLKIDVDKMHAYRDAIRGIDGRRVVRYAATMYPGPVHSYFDGLEALSANPERSEELELLLAERITRWIEANASAEERLAVSGGGF